MFDVVMPLYNKEKFVGQAIESVLVQSFTDWRLFVVDDGSIDHGSDVVRGFHDPRISLIEQSNQGVGPARNAAIEAGSAEWIAFLDADDLWSRDHLQELDEVRRAFPQAGLIGCAFRRFSEQVAPAPARGHVQRRVARYFAECALGRELFWTSSAAVRRSVLAEIGTFKPLPGNEDVELWARVALKWPVAISTRPTVQYRVETGGITDVGTAGHAPAAKPSRREELSSTIPTLEAALADVDDPELRQDILDYMDSRVGIRLVRAVLDGDMPYARQLTALYRGKPRGKARVAAAIAALPANLGRGVIAGVLPLKRRLVRG
jgi:glycosyltransferase involved in cell wall biosynthesis